MDLRTPALAALVSYPYSHQTRYHGIFANRSRLRRHLPPPPPRPEDPDIEDAVPLGMDVGGSRHAGVTEQASPARRCRVPWAQLLRRLLHIDALACPRCSTPSQSVPIVVLAFLTDPDVVSKILHHLGLPTTAPTLAPARTSSDQPFLLQELAPLMSSALGCIVIERGAYERRQTGGALQRLQHGSFRLFPSRRPLRTE